MAERRRFTTQETAIGAVVLVVVFLLVFLGGGALNLPVPQWLLAAIAAAIGIAIWFAIINRRTR
jgi:protein-S-isoprenylcysteine O-methyltransferase Ste14